MNYDYAVAYWPEMLQGNGYQPEYCGPANLEWLDRLIAENKAGLVVIQATQKAPEPFTGLYLVQGGRTGKSRSTARLELMPKPVAMRKRYGLRAIIRIANELEFALNHIRRESDIERLLAMEPHLRRVDQIARQLTRAAAKARRQTEREYSLFED